MTKKSAYLFLLTYIALLPIQAQSDVFWRLMSISLEPLPIAQKAAHLNEITKEDKPLSDTLLPKMRDIEICEGQELALHAPHVEGAVVYIWQGANKFFSDKPAPKIPHIPLKQAGNYSLVGLNSSNDTLYHSKFKVSVNGVKRDTIKASFCMGAEYVFPNGKVAREPGFYDIWREPKKDCGEISVYHLTNKENGYIPVYQYVSLLNGAKYRLPDGSIANRAGFYSHSVPTGMGCDSLIFTLIEDRWRNLPPVYFAVDAYFLRPDALMALNEWAQFLRENTNLKVEIIGHTDTEGDAAYNLVLAQYRASSVVKYLQDRGIAADRMFIKSVGEQEPVFPAENTEAQKQKNRRVEFRIENTKIAGMTQIFVER